MEPNADFRAQWLRGWVRDTLAVMASREQMLEVGYLDEPGLDLDAVRVPYISTFGPGEVADRLNEIHALLSLMVASGDHALWEPAGLDSPLWRVVRRTAKDALDHLDQTDGHRDRGEA